MEPRSRSRAAALLPEAAVALLFLGLAALATRPLVLHLRTHLHVGADPVSHLWMMSWLSGHLASPRELFEGNIYHPARHAALFTDLSLGTAVLLAPARLVVRDPVPLYNLGLILALAFSGWSFQTLVRELTGNRWAGILSGVLAAFGSHQMTHLPHLNLLTTGWLALFLLGLHRTLERPTPGAVLLTGVAFALNAQSSGYYAVASVLLGLTFAAVSARSLRRPRTLAALAAAALVAVVLTLPYALAFRELRAEHGLQRPPGMSARMAFAPGRDLSSHSYAYRWLLDWDGERMFPGLLTIVLAAAALLQKRPASGFYGVAAAVLLAVSLGPGSGGLPLPYDLLFAVPPLDSMRHPFTFAAVATFALAVLAGIGWSGLALSSRTWTSLAVVALAVAETVAPALPLRAVPPGVPPAYQVLDRLPPGPVLEVPVFEEDTLLWAARHGRPVLNGIGAFAPLDTLLLERYIRNHWIARVPQDVDASRPTPFLLERFPVRYVIVPAGRKPGLRRLAAAFDRSRTFVLAAEAADGDRVYEVRR